MIDSHDYAVHLESTGRKEGILHSPDDLPKVDVAAPPEFGGPERVWSPEHLFVAAVSSCLMTTFLAIAEMSKLEIVDYRDEASGHMIREERLFRIESVTLRPRITIADAQQLDRAHRLIEKAERACMISRSVSAEIRMEPTIEVSELI